jgi:hypothetical protein
MRLHARVASAAVSVALFTIGLPMARLEARGLGGHGGASMAPGRPLYHPAYGRPMPPYGRPMPPYGRPIFPYGKPLSRPAVSYFVEPDHRFGGFRGNGWRFGSPVLVGPYWPVYWPGFYSGFLQGPGVIGMPYRGWGRFHLVNGERWVDRYRRGRLSASDQDWGGETPVWSGGYGVTQFVGSGYGGTVTGSGPDAPYTGSALYYPPRQGRPKIAADADSLPQARTADARLPRVIYGIQPQWGAPSSGPHVIYSQP